LPQGPGTDVSSQNLFPLGDGDAWTYGRYDADGNYLGQVGVNVSRHLGSDPEVFYLHRRQDDQATHDLYRKNSVGRFMMRPLSDEAPSSARQIIGEIAEYLETLYPPGSVRRSYRQGEWSVDLDGDGEPEGFTFEFTQTHVGASTVELPFGTVDVVQFRNRTQLTLIPSRRDLPSSTLTVVENNAFASHLGMVSSDIEILEPGSSMGTRSRWVLTDAMVGAQPWGREIDGRVTGLALPHRALAYDEGRNLYYASIPRSGVSTGGAIATIHPSDGRVGQIGLPGVDPDAIALAADGSVLYASVRATGEILKLSLPSMQEIGRARLPVTSDGVQQYVESLAVSGSDPELVIIAMARPDRWPTHTGVILMRQMQVGTNALALASGGNVVAFAPSGDVAYALATQVSGYAFNRLVVTPDGLALETFSAGLFGAPSTRRLDQAGGRIAAGNRIYGEADFSLLGLVDGAGNCSILRFSGKVACADEVGTFTNFLTVVEPTTNSREAILTYASTPPASTLREVISGPVGQVAISFPQVDASWTSYILLINDDRLR